MHNWRELCNFYERLHCFFRAPFSKFTKGSFSYTDDSLRNYREMAICWLQNMHKKPTKYARQTRKDGNNAGWIESKPIISCVRDHIVERVRSDHKCIYYCRFECRSKNDYWSHHFLVWLLKNWKNQKNLEKWRCRNSVLDLYGVKILLFIQYRKPTMFAN